MTPRTATRHRPGGVDDLRGEPGLRKYDLLGRSGHEHSALGLGPQEQELFLDTSASEPALRPELVVT